MKYRQYDCSNKKTQNKRTLEIRYCVAMYAG